MKKGTAPIALRYETPFKLLPIALYHELPFQDRHHESGLYHATGAESPAYARHGEGDDIVIEAPVLSQGSSGLA